MSYVVVVGWYVLVVVFGELVVMEGGFVILRCIDIVEDYGEVVGVLCGIGEFVLGDSDFVGVLGDIEVVVVVVVEIYFGVKYIVGVLVGDVVVVGVGDVEFLENDVVNVV